jgi:dynactin 4
MSKRDSRNLNPDEDSEDEEKTFDPHHPRAAFSLFPPEHLLYCEECHDIKCPRCVTEEIICWYCPSCLFETPSSMVRSEGNRCARNCFNCPICTSQLITASLGDSKEGPFILNCNYCAWTTLDVGITFDKPTNLRQQLDRIANGGIPKRPQKAQDSLDAARKSSLAQEPFSTGGDQNDSDNNVQPKEPQEMDPPARFKALRSFYKDQITAASSSDSGLPASALDLAYSSPSSLARIMSLYSNLGGSSLKKSRPKPTLMREALTAMEGLHIADTSRTTTPAYSDTPSDVQRLFQNPSYLGDPDATSITTLRPMPTLLRTKRSKRCAACKHILVKPEFKPTSTRYRIKLIALNYIPFPILKPLPIPGGLLPTGPDGGDVVLSPGKATQFVLTLKNPQFENMKVSLGSPSKTPGRHPHRVTILCPQFEIGKSGDVWDDALDNPLNRSIIGSRGGDQIAGRLYDQGRNWASVVVEITPATSLLGLDRELEGDEDVIEVPIRVRLEWTVTAEEDEHYKKFKSERLLAEGGEADDGKREVSYWMVLGVGRVGIQPEDPA